MMIAFFIAAAAFSSAWQFETESDPLGQKVYVASVAPEAERPHVALRFLCGGVTGVVLQFNLGDVETDGPQYSTDEPGEESVRFSFIEGNYDTNAKRAPITDGLGTFEIKGSEAAFIAGLLRESDRVSVQRGDVSFSFPLDGANGAIGEVLSTCPYKYVEEK